MADVDNGSWLKRHSYFIAILALVIVQTLAIFYFQRPLRTIFIPEPHAWIDYDTHLEQSFGVIEALDRFGKAWSYDPTFLAGYPHGTIFDADNKGWELFTYAFWKLGLPQGMAFNLYILLAHLLVPWVFLFAARLFGFDRTVAVTAAFMALGLWFFDAYPRWTMWVGMTAYAIAGYVFILPLALLYRYLKDGRLLHLGLLAVTLGLAHLNHPYSFVILIFPMGTLYIRAFKTLTPAKHLALAGVACITIAINAYWLITAIRFWHYILNSAFYAQSTLSFLLTDYLGLLQEPLVSGVIGNRTGLRFIFLSAALFGLWLFWRASDERWMPFAVGLAAMFALTYLGSYSLAFAQIQPYRHALPGMYLTILPAAAFFVKLTREKTFGNLPWMTSALGCVGIILLGGNLTRDMLYFTPKLLPDVHMEEVDQIAIKTTNSDIPGILGPHLDLRHEPIYDDFTKIYELVEKNDNKTGRILVEWWILGEHLVWRTDSHILGGFLERNLEHSAANLFRREYDKGSPFSEEEVKQYLIDYAVKWLIVSHPDVELVKNEDLFELVTAVPPIHWVYKVKLDVSFFAENHGTINTSMNKIEVTGTNPAEDVVLRFHWMETLVCKKDCSLEREPIKGDPVGFIRIPAPHPADLVIENSYQF